jgi:hypothetical protein
MTISVDSSEVNAAIQELKVAVEAFVNAKVYLRDDAGKELGVSSIQSISAKNEGLRNVLKACVPLVESMGGELVISDGGKDESDISMKRLGFCGVQEPFGNRICSFPPEHVGEQHSWA